MVIFNKSGGLISTVDMNTFFGVSTGGDGHVIYNEITGRFAIEVIESLNSGGTGTAGQTFQFTFNTPGTFPYHCSIHPPSAFPGFIGTITVTP